MTIINILGYPPYINQGLYIYIYIWVTMQKQLGKSNYIFNIMKFMISKHRKLWGEPDTETGMMSQDACSFRFRSNLATCFPNPAVYAPLDRKRFPPVTWTRPSGSLLRIYMPFEDSCNLFWIARERRVENDSTSGLRSGCKDHIYPGKQLQVHIDISEVLKRLTRWLVFPKRKNFMYIHIYIYIGYVFGAGQRKKFKA